MPWFAPLFNESMAIRDGMIDIPQRPGSGFSFNPEAIRRYQLHQ
jgi:L-alanine-DL-glutamate epimerase-like enolase superfamily enzyme